MRKMSTCMECLKRNGVPNFNMVYMDITDDGVYEIECDKGHKSYEISQNEKFQILFDMGASALNNGYKNEAVVCFTTSLERFYEWFISLIITKNKVNRGEFNKTWKLAISQSERQLGGFYFLYLQEFKEVPPENIKVKFRNKVIHKGYISSYEEVYDYGEYVMSYIRNIIAKLEDKLGEELNDLLFKVFCDRTNELSNKYNITNSISTSSSPTIISLNDKEESHKNMSFAEALKFVREREEILGGL